jgi:endonuclease/exonuclease/phosphatase (EEP) superfamily protein YafD
VTIDYPLSPAPEVPKQPKQRRHTDWSGATVGVLFGIAGLVLARLGHLWVGFDVFSQFSAQFIFLTLSMAAGLAMPRYKGLVGSVLFVVAVVAYALWPQFNSSKFVAAVPAAHSKLKLAHFNPFIFNTDYAAIKASILKMDPDVMTFVEIGQDKLKLLNELRGQFPYQMDCFDVVNCDAAIISKFPLSNRVAKGNWTGAPFISASLGQQFSNVTVFGFHTTRFPHSRAQFIQVRAIVKYLETIATPIIVMGDFNATPFSRISDVITQGLDLKRLSNLPTWPATYGFPQLAIDHIFVSQNILPLNAEEIGDNATSDHFPITITVAVPQK